MANVITSVSARVKNNYLSMARQIKEAMVRLYIKEDDLTQSVDSIGCNLLYNGCGSEGGVETTNGNTALKNFLNSYSAYDDKLELISDGNLLDGVPYGFSTAWRTYLGTSAEYYNRNRIMALNPNSAYVGHGSVIPSVKSALKGQRLYSGLSFFDFNGYNINSMYTMHYGLAKLAQDLVLGTDTHMYITRDGFMKDSSGADIPPFTEWGMQTASSASYRNGPIFWDHHYSDLKVDQKTGEDIPFTRSGYPNTHDKPAGFGYSRHMIYNLWEPGAVPELVGNHNGYTDVWRVPIKPELISSSNTKGIHHIGHAHSPDSTATVIPKDTWLSRNWAGGSYKYCWCVGTSINDPTFVYRYTGWIGGTDYSGSNYNNSFPPGGLGAIPMMLGSYGSGTNDPDEKQYHSAMSIHKDPMVSLEEKQVGLIPEHHRPVLRKEVNGVQSVFTVNVIDKVKRNSV